MAKLNTPSVRDLYDSFVADYLSRTGQSTPLLLSAYVRTIAWAHAGLTVLLYRLGQWVYFQMFLDTCSFAALQLYGERVDINYKTATNNVAVLQVQNIGSSVTSISSGTLFITDAGVSYQTSEDTPVVSGTATCTITSVLAGDAYNVQVSDQLTFANPPSADVPEYGTVSSVSVEGADAETEDDYRARVKLRYRSRAQGGAPYDYYLWATEVSGIGSAYVYVVKPGITSVYVATDDSQADRAPSTSLLSQVESSLRQDPDSSVYDRHPVQAELNVQSVEFREYTVTITGLDATANTTANRTSVRDALIEYFDERNPQVPALGYTREGATVSDSGATLSAMEVLVNAEDSGTFEDLAITPTTDGKDTLPAGTLANMTSLTINGISVSLS